MSYRDPKTGRWAPPPKTKVFVYGTLKKHYHNHVVLGESVFLGTALTDTLYRMLNAGFPVIREEPGGRPVLGEVYECDSRVLRNLDGLEREGRMYDRKRVVCAFKNREEREEVECSIYVGCAHWDAHAPHLGPNDHYVNADGELEWTRDPVGDRRPIRDDQEPIEPEDQSQGDLEGADNERNQP